MSVSPFNVSMPSAGYAPDGAWMSKDQVTLFHSDDNRMDELAHGYQKAALIKLLDKVCDFWDSLWHQEQPTGHQLHKREGELSGTISQKIYCDAVSTITWSAGLQFEGQPIERACVHEGILDVMQKIASDNNRTCDPDPWVNFYLDDVIFSLINSYDFSFRVNVKLHGNESPLIPDCVGKKLSFPKPKFDHASVFVWSGPLNDMYRACFANYNANMHARRVKVGVSAALGSLLVVFVSFAVIGVVVSRNKIPERTPLNAVVVNKDTK